MFSAFPKIFSLGTDYIKDIFEEEVEITEKLDGSQFSFGKIDGEVLMRSKGKQIFPGEVGSKMFDLAMDYVQKISDKLPEGLVFYCEYLMKPRHNALAYDKIPLNNLALFGVMDINKQSFCKYLNIVEWADELDIDVVPMLGCGTPMCKINDIEDIKKLLETDSYLGGQKIEGFVVKNYERKFLLGGQPMPLMAGKFVSEKFKEVHKEAWGRGFTTKGRWEEFKDSFKTEARWEKAIQHLKENGKLTNSPKDIGALIIEVQKDLGQEEKETIKNWLWKEYGKDLLRRSVVGLPEYYKEKLLNNSFNKKNG